MTTVLETIACPLPFLVNTVGLMEPVRCGLRRGADTEKRMPMREERDGDPIKRCRRAGVVTGPQRAGWAPKPLGLSIAVRYRARVPMGVARQLDDGLRRPLRSQPCARNFA